MLDSRARHDSDPHDCLAARRFRRPPWSRSCRHHGGLARRRTRRRPGCEFPAEVRQQFLDAYAQASKGIAPGSGADSDGPARPIRCIRTSRPRGCSAGSMIRRPLRRSRHSSTATAISRSRARSGASWLMALALRKQWDAYLAAYRAGRGRHRSPRAAMRYAARIALGRTDGLADRSSREWSAPKSLPPACDPAFDWLRVAGTADVRR